MYFFGKQCIVVALDVKRTFDKKGKYMFSKDGKDYWFEIQIFGGKKATGIDAIEWAKKSRNARSRRDTFNKY